MAATHVLRLGNNEEFRKHVIEIFKKYGVTSYGELPEEGLAELFTFPFKYKLDPIK